MSTVLLSEIRKLTTTRSWIVLLAVTAAAAVVFSGIYVVVGLVGSTTDPPRNMFDDPSFVATVHTSGNSAARILAIIAGAMAMGAEFRHKTLSVSFLGRGSSWQALLLNIVSLALWTMIGFGFVTVGTSPEANAGPATPWRDPGYGALDV